VSATVVVVVVVVVAAYLTKLPVIVNNEVKGCGRWPSWPILRYQPRSSPWIEKAGRYSNGPPPQIELRSVNFFRQLAQYIPVSNFKFFFDLSTFTARFFPSDVLLFCESHFHGRNSKLQLLLCLLFCRIRGFQSRGFLLVSFVIYAPTMEVGAGSSSEISVKFTG
jgi:hypothetical protein